MLRVQLFSIPQQSVASKTKIEPYEKLNSLFPSTDRIILETVISAIAIHSFLETFSLKSRSAIIAVATISKFPRSEASEAFPSLIPIIRKIGAAISRIIIPRV